MGKCSCGRTFQGTGSRCPQCRLDERWEDTFENTDWSGDDEDDDEKPEVLTDGGQNISTVFARLAELADAEGAVPEDGSGIGGVWTTTVTAGDRDRDWNIAMNADTENEHEIEGFPSEDDTTSVRAGAATIWLGRMPAGVLNPFGGQFFVEVREDGPTSIEDEVLRDIESALLEAGADIERTIPNEPVVTDGGVSAGHRGPPVDSVLTRAGMGDQDPRCKNGTVGCPGPGTDVGALPCFACLFEGGEDGD